MKYGHAPNQWNEFIVEAYANYQFDAIFLTGLPDVPSQLAACFEDLSKLLRTRRATTEMNYGRMH